MKPSPVRLLRTTSTPAPPVASRISFPNAVWRLSKTCSTPSERRYPCFGSLAVAKTSAPAACTHWMAARPTPPAPAWTRTRSPAARPVNSKESAAETNALGTVASPVTENPGGAGATSSSWVTIAAANAPKPSPTIGSPTETRETSEPTSRMRPHISRPRFPSGMKPSERNTSQKLSPAASTPTRTSRGSSGGAGSGLT